MGHVCSMITPTPVFGVAGVGGSDQPQTVANKSLPSVLSKTAMPPKKGANAAAKGAPGSGKKKGGNDKDNPPADSALPSSLKDTNSEFWPKVQSWVDTITSERDPWGLAEC